MASKPSTTLRARPAGLLSAALAVAVVLGVVLAAIAAVNVVHHRDTAIAATDLRLAVVTVSPVEDLSGFDAEDLQTFDDAVGVISTAADSELLTPLTAADRQSAVEELSEMTTHLQQLRRGETIGEEHHGVRHHADFENLMRDLVVEESRLADVSQRNVAVGLVLAAMAFAALCAVQLAMRSARSRRRAKTEAMAQAADRFGRLLDDSLESTAIIGPDGSVLYQAASLANLFPGTTLTTVESFLDLAVDGDRKRLFMQLQTSGALRQTLTFRAHPRVPTGDDEPREFVIRVSDLRDDPLVGGWLVALREVSAEAEARRMLTELAETDALTGLPNRAAFLREAEEFEGAFTLLMTDLDDFKSTNDAFGHESGDELLVAVSQRFTRCLGDNDRIFHIAGDEFAVVRPGSNPLAIETLAQSLLNVLADPIVLRAGREVTSVSIGVAASKPGSSPESMLYRADIAMYEAKRGGGNRVAYINETMEAASERRRNLRRALTRASLSEFSLVYQPIVDAETRRTKSVEALLRWTSPVMGAITPDVFIPLAEESNRIVEIGIWVLKQACADLASWRARGIGMNLGVTINVSPLQLVEPGFLVEVESALEWEGLQPEDLTIEVTESALIDDNGDTYDRLRHLRAMGCNVACDDFGAGYSNLGQLMTLPLNIIKIDRGLVTSVSAKRALAGKRAETKCEVSAAIVKIATAMNARVVAEGVETEPQLQSLAASGVHLIQGYLVSRPIPANEILIRLHGEERDGSSDRESATVEASSFSS